MRTMTISGLVLLAASGSMEARAACTRQVINRTPHLIVATQDGGPSFTVGPRRSRTIRYASAGRVDIAVYCRAPGTRPTSSIPPQPPAFTSTYAIAAILDRCWVDIDRGGTQPIALNNPRQGDIVVAPYGLACP